MRFTIQFKLTVILNQYLDDFLIAGSQGSDECANCLAIALATFKTLGLPVALEKNEGPATSVPYLGILIDTLRGEIRLPPDKLARIAQELRKWCEKKAASKRELLSLIGLLHHAASVVVPGRPFLRHLITLSKSVKHLHYMVRLNLAARSDILWWHTFMSTWNGLAFMPFHPVSAGIPHLRCLRVMGLWRLLGFTLVPTGMDISDALAEYYIHGAASHSPGWWSSRVICYCDNEAAVAVINKGSAKDPRLVQLL